MVVRGFTTLLIVFGFGSAGLSFIGFNFRILAWADAYQPGAGLIIGSVGLLLLILTVMFSKDSPAPTAPGYQQDPSAPQGFAQPGGHPQQGHPQPGYPQGAPVSPPQGFAQPGPQGYAPQGHAPQGYGQQGYGAPVSPPQGFAQPVPPHGHPQGAPVSPPQGFPQQPYQQQPYPQQQGQYAPPQSFGPQG